MKSFEEMLISEIFASLGNHYANNYDSWRTARKRSLKRSLKTGLKALLPRMSAGRIACLRQESYQEALRRLSPYLPGIRDLYELLGDQESRRLLVKLIAYKLLGEEKVKLPLNSAEFWRTRRQVDAIKAKDDSISAPWVEDSFINLYRFALGERNGLDGALQM